MHGHETDAGANQGWDRDDPTPCWYRPLGSTESARLLTELVAERLQTTSGSDPLISGDGGVEVDALVGVIRTRDWRWSATLAPLAAQLADIPPEGWSIVIDREVERWRRAVRGVRRLTPTSEPGRLPPDPATVALRLTTADGAPGQVLRPAFGPVVWELVRDLGADGRAISSVGADGPAEAGTGAEQLWDRVATETVARYEEGWAGLPLAGAMGVILSGPHVSALLYDTDRLRHRAEEHTGATALRIAVISNSLLLVTAGGENHPNADLLAESLRRFASGPRRHFDPFTLDLPNTDVTRTRP